MKLNGVYVAIVTPFKADGSLDLEALNRHLDYLVKAGVDGFVPCGTTGESPTLSRQERVQIIQACLDHARPKGLGVIAGCGSNSTSAARELIAEAEEMGSDATLVVTPYYNKPTPAGLTAHYLHLADHARKPIVLYHVPGRTNVSLPLDVVSRLFEHPMIGGIKEASGQFSYWLGLAKITQATGRTLLAGDDDAFAVIQSLGGKGIISASANALPEAFVKLNALTRERRWDEASALQLRLAPLLKSFFAETNPAPVKYVLARRRGESGTLRLPLVPVSQATQALIDREWEAFHEGGA